MLSLFLPSSDTESFYHRVLRGRREDRREHRKENGREDAEGRYRDALHQIIKLVSQCLR